MKISYNWLKELVDANLSPRDLAAKLTMAGLAVDAVEERGNDHVLEFDLTSNRPDCLSHLGIAREAAAVSGRSVRMPRVSIDAAKTRTSDVASVEILNPDLCPRYSARAIRGVKIGPSPAWLVERLEAMGQRSVNNVADITNYVMLEMGQPLHAFDLEMLRGKQIIVRAAKPGEKITTLDGEERELTDQMLVIADAERPVALAGIKGGEDSGITEKTVDVLLEAAHFTPAQVRATSKALGLATEASYRFERGTDPEIVVTASDRAAALIAEVAGGEVLDGVVDVYPRKAARRPIAMRRNRHEAITGLKIELGEAEYILRSLGFAVEANVDSDRLRAIPPSWRVDVSIEEDLIEEIARVCGYDRLRNTLPGSAGAGAYLPNEENRRAIRHTLASLGYHEAINFSFVNGETDGLVGIVRDEDRLRLRNPIDETQAHMRTTLLGGLLRSLEHNFNHGTRNVRLFEIGKCFLKFCEEPEEDSPEECETLALVATGARNEADWRDSSARLDFYDVKGALEAVFESLGLPTGRRWTAEFSEHSYKFLHPGRQADINLGKESIGQFGQLHPRVAALYKFKQPVYVAELNLELLLLAPRSEVRYHPLPKFPAVARDLAVLINTNVAFADVDLAIRAQQIKELVSLRLFDLYAGKELPEGKHSIALSLLYRADDRTLTDEEANALHEQVIKTLKRKFGAEIR
jgi:phenylalanyl-tRNA synthetase beta chain